MSAVRSQSYKTLFRKSEEVKQEKYHVHKIGDYEKLKTATP